MRIAIVVDNIYRAQWKSGIKKIMLFDVEGEVITAVDEDTLSISDLHYLYLWLLGKGVERLYCDGMGGSAKEFLAKAGIEIYPLRRIRDHPLLQALLIKDEKENS